MARTKTYTIPKSAERLIRDIAAGYDDPFRLLEMPAGWRPAVKAGLVERLDNGRVRLTARGEQAASLFAGTTYDHKAEPSRLTIFA